MGGYSLKGLEREDKCNDFKLTGPFVAFSGGIPLGNGVQRTDG